jgi:rhamnulokinase
MWLIQSIRRNTGKKYSFDEMMEMAKSSSYICLINPNDESFVAPENMIEAVRAYLNEPELPLADVIKSVYLSLANSYNEAVKEIEKISGKTVSCINIVGGGCQDSYLNQLTKEITGKKVLAGPIEATATGNIVSQFMYLDKNLTLEMAREIIKNSFDIKETL